MAEWFEAANSLTWPGAFAVAGVAIAIAWVFVTMFKGD